MSGAPRFVAIGECMVELAPAGDGLLRMGFAGDTFNTAWYARRLLPDAWSVDYATCIGTDPASEDMAAFMEAAGIGTAHVRRLPAKGVGLYLITLKDGERSFAYWRSDSAARRLADDPAALDAAMAGAAIVYFSGITLAILPPEGRAALCAAVARARAAGALTAFDTNLRPRLWKDEDAMRAGLTQGARAAEIVLPGLDEDAPLFGDADADATVARYRDAGAGTVCVKDGAGAIRVWSRDGGDARVAPEPRTPVDTTAAGDSFAAAFLARHGLGDPAEDAARHAARIAGQVIAASGALVPIDP